MFQNPTKAQTVAIAILLIGFALALPNITFLHLDFSEIRDIPLNIIQLGMILYGLDLVYRNLVYDYRG